MMRIVVDLPAPFGPRNPVTRPGRAVKLTWSTAVNSPYFLVTDSRVIMRSVPVWLVGDGDQWQTEVAHLLDQAVQGRLVGDLAADERAAVVVGEECHAVEPGGPPVGPGGPGPGSRRSRSRSWPASVGADVGSADHHMW